MRENIPIRIEMEVYFRKNRKVSKLLIVNLDFIGKGKVLWDNFKEFNKLRVF